MRIVLRRRTAFAWILFFLSLVAAAPAAAQSGGFVYALDQVNGAPNQIFGFSVNSTTGVLSALAGFPVSTGGNGGVGAFSQHLFYDRVNSRLYAINESSATVSGFAVNRFTGALTALPFSPIALPAGDYGCVAADPTGAVLAATGSSGVATFLIGGTTATAAPGSPFVAAGASPFSCVFSQDGAYFYAGGNVGNLIGGFAVNATNAVLTPLAGSPFDSGAANPVGYATDATGRLFVSNFGSGVRAFTTTAGIPSAVAGNPFASGLTGGVQGVVSPSGFYMVADRSGNRVGVFSIGSTGALAAVSGSPFASGGTFTSAVALDHRGTLLFASNGNSRNITTFRVASTNPALTSLTTQAANAVGATGIVTGIAFAPPANGGFVYALDQVNVGTNQVYGFSVDATTGALTALAGFPKAAGTGGGGSFSEQLSYDRVNGRLFVLNDTAGAGSVSVFAVNQGSGALTELSFSPIALPSGAGNWACLTTAAADGSVLIAAGSLGVAGFKLTATSAVAAPGGPFPATGASPFSCAASRDGAFFYTGGNSGSVAAGFSVNATNGALTALPGSPFATGGSNPVGYATDPSGRLFVSNFGTTLNVFTTSSGIPTPVSGGPFTSGLTGGVRGVVTATGFYVVADRSGNRVGSYVIGGAGAGTTLTAASGSPFATGGTLSDAVDADDTGTLAFAANGSSRNITTFGVSSAGVLASLGVQAANTLGAAGIVTGIAFAPRAASSATSEVTTAGGPRGITKGPDGNVWYTEIAANKVARITPVGIITEFPAPSASGPDGITTGPDGNLWYAGFNGNKIGRVTPAGVVTEFAAGALGGPALIASGPDGNLWFTEFSSHKIGRMTTAGTLTEFSAGITASAQPYGIAAGPDGNLWFTESAANKIGRITVSGAVTEFPLPTPNSFPAAIVAGPDGALWFAETGTTGTADRIGRITTSGAVTEFGGLSAGPGGITLGPDNNLWFSTGLGVGRITPTGAVTEYTPPTSPIGSATFPAFITAGPDGNIWFAEQSNNKVSVLALPHFGLSLLRSGTGSGTVTSAPAGVSCGSTCGASFADGEIVVLTATPAAGSRFAGWSGGGCSGIGTCVVTMNASAAVTAAFVLQQFTLTVTPTGTGTGTVTSSPAGINCGATCAMIVDVGTVVTLNAALPADTVFGGWSGGGCGAAPTCIVTVSATTNIGATFTFQLPTVTLSTSRVNFGAVNNGAGTLVKQTPAQTITLTQNIPGAVTWTASADQPWITVTPASGTINDTITVAIQNTAHTLPTVGVVSGTVTLTTTGAANNPTATINLTVLIGASLPPDGSFDTPANGTGGVTGSIAVTGWAVDDIGATRVRIMRAPVAGEDPASQVFIGNAIFVTGARTDVAATFPLKPYFDRAGWGYLMLTNFLPNHGNGTFTLFAYADDVEGNSTLLGSKTITCTNATATLPFGAIDTPDQGATVSGAAFVNFGWVLAAQPTASGLFIPFGGSTITVFVDSVSVGTLASYNNARADIQALFPGYANTDGAVGIKFIDTTTLTNGVHTIFWIASDNLGATAGIGSRFFTVANSGAGLMAAPLRAGGIVSGTAITVTRGPDVAAAAEVVVPNGDGLLEVTAAPAERMTLTLDPRHVDATYRGYEVANGESKPLPIGAHLDEHTGEFAWLPAPGFGGTHHLVFIRSANGQEELIRVDVTIALSGPGK